MRVGKPQLPFKHPYSAQEKFLILKGIKRHYVFVQADISTMTRRKPSKEKGPPVAEITIRTPCQSADRKHTDRRHGRRSRGRVTTTTRRIHTPGQSRSSRIAIGKRR